MRFRTVRTLALSLVVLSFIISRPASSQLSQAQITQKVDSVMNALMAMDLSPGAGIVVVRDTQIVYMKGFGFADIAAKRPFTPETEFYIASTTKSFTGLAAALLDRKGTFKLDAPLHQYLPALKLRLDEVNGKLEAHLGAAWSAIEVFDNTKNLLRIALFGSGEVVTVTMSDRKASALTFGGNEYKGVN